MMGDTYACISIVEYCMQITSIEIHRLAEGVATTRRSCTYTTIIHTCSERAPTLK